VTAEMVNHVQKSIIRTGDGRIAEVQEHSWPEPASEHAKHASSNAEALRAHERAVERKTVLQGQVAEFRGRVIALQDQLSEVREEAALREKRISAEYETKLSIAHGREKQIRSECDAKIRAAQAREKQTVADAQDALKNIPSPLTMVAPEAGQLATDYLSVLADLELQLAEFARLEGRSAPSREVWALPPGTDAAPASEAAS